MEPHLPPGAARPDDPPTRSPAAAGLLRACACLVLAACLSDPPKPEMRVTTLVRIERPEGEFFSPRMPGPGRTLTKIYLRPSSGGGLIVVAVLGPYLPAVLGRPGDVVLLTYPGPIEPGREIAFEDLIGYTVVSRAGLPRSPI